MGPFIVSLPYRHLFPSSRAHLARQNLSRQTRLVPANALDVREPTASVQQLPSSETVDTEVESPLGKLEKSFKLSGTSS